MEMGIDGTVLMGNSIDSRRIGDFLVLVFSTYGNTGGLVIQYAVSPSQDAFCQRHEIFGSDSDITRRVTWKDGCQQEPAATFKKNTLRSQVFNGVHHEEGPGCKLGRKCNNTNFGHEDV